MDPATIALMMAGSSALPGILSMFQGAPQMPNAPQPPPLPPGWGGYQNTMMNDAFSPQSGLLQTSLDRSDANIMRTMANQGMGNSSMAQGALSMQNAEITRNWQQQEEARRAQAMQSVMQANQGQFGMQHQGYGDAYQNYMQSLKNSGAFAQGVGSMAGGLAGAYGYYANNRQPQQQPQPQMNAFGGTSGSGYYEPGRTMVG